MIIRTTIAAVAVITLAACGGPPKTAQGQAASLQDVGPAPTMHGELFARYLNATLKDPYTAQVQQVAGPAPWVKPSTWGSSESTYGWGVCFTVNARNAFGGYTGTRWYVPVFRGEQLITVIGPSGRNTIQEDAVISDFCRSAG
jgi:hypothetical protein